MMRYVSRAPRLAVSLALALFCIASAPAMAQRDRAWQDVSEFPLFGDEGQRVANHAVAAALSAEIERLPGAVVVGNAKSAVTLAEFYDLNCPYCRMAAADLADLVDTDADFRLMLVPFPVLGVASIQAGRVELAVAKLGSPQQFYQFHRKIYGRRGLVDGERALEVAQELGFARDRLVAVADSEEITETMKAHVRLGDALGLAATPGFVVKAIAVLGYPGRHALQTMIDAAAACGKIVC